MEDPGTRAHGPNESLHLATFERACLAEALLLRNLALSRTDWVRALLYPERAGCVPLAGRFERLASSSLFEPLRAADRPSRASSSLLEPYAKTAAA